MVNPSSVQYAPRFCACGCGQRPRNWKAEYVAGHRPVASLAQRLWPRVTETPSGCWEWTGYRGPAGYGQISRTGGGLVGTHRAAWEVAYGPIPDGMFVCHACDNPPCCNPEHLFLGSPADNVQDRADKGRTARGQKLPQTRLTDDDVRSIRRDYNPRSGEPKRGGRSSNASELADRFGVTREYVMQVVHGHYRKGVA